MTEPQERWAPRSEAMPKRDLPTLPNRLSWVMLEHGNNNNSSSSYWWPAILHPDISDYLDYNDGQNKVQLATDIMDNHGCNVMIAQYLGRGLEYTLLKEGTDYYTYTDMLQHAMVTLSQPRTFTDHLELYPDFMKALDEAYDILKSDGTKSNKQSKRGQELLAAYQGFETPKAAAAAAPSVAALGVMETPRKAAKVAFAEAATPRVNNNSSSTSKRKGSVMQEIEDAALMAMTPLPAGACVHWEKDDDGVMRAVKNFADPDELDLSTVVATETMDSFTTPVAKHTALLDAEDSGKLETQDDYVSLLPLVTQDVAMPDAEEFPKPEDVATAAEAKDAVEGFFTPEAKAPIGPTETENAPLCAATGAEILATPILPAAKDSDSSPQAGDTGMPDQPKEDDEELHSSSAAVILASEDSELPDPQEIVKTDETSTEQPSTTKVSPNKKTTKTMTKACSSTCNDDEVIVKESRRSTRFGSSSATVVSEADSELEKDDAAESTTSATRIDIHSLTPVPVDRTDSFQEVTAELVFAGWTRENVGSKKKKTKNNNDNDKEPVGYYPPGNKTEYLNEFQVREYLKKQCGWEGDEPSSVKRSLDLGSPEVTPLIAEKEQEGIKTTSGKRKLEMDAGLSTTKYQFRTPKQKRKKQGAGLSGRKTKTYTPPPPAKPKLRSSAIETPLRKSSRTTPVRGKTERRIMPKEGFYCLRTLWPFLRACLNWGYLNGGQFHPFKYVVGDMAGPTGKEGVDFFYDEYEVVQYCMRNKYEQKYAELKAKWKNDGRPGSRSKLDSASDWKPETPKQETAQSERE
eukprot:CAMPEP_0117021160 /NCGR_PEP_ID=MMETSP0472-20121206/15996_1 /TAXON_ID=693140 ORGANISM="Tiarina fusus, Strain LIS" /NCGR_SAMPLE_ID=MMETSP0472 /ASSEMBLY_ACC=CAM_ASM_000603 /LENGTH=802 /DNA_ID=CAMNT_0004726563 /DNA_START=42 /DNA_END=2450 /DNA_ORIENTATION=+